MVFVMFKRTGGIMVEITIVGTGCTKCKKLEDIVKEAVSDMNINADIKKMTDIKEIVQAGILMTPGLIIDGKVEFTGKVPSKEDVKKIIKSSL